jgi:hypothetical protein
MMSLWSPGTADLLDYSDILCAVPLLRRTSGNPTLCNLNRNRRSAPDRGLGAIAGTDSMRLLELFNNALQVTKAPKALEILEQAADVELPDEESDPVSDVLSLGFLTTGCLESDSVVCVWSATAKKGGGPNPFNNVVVPALKGKIDEFPPRENFDHFDGGGPTQSFVDYRDEKIVPTLSDWMVAKTLSPGVVTVQPTQSSAGVLAISVGLDFNANHGDLEGVVRVVYGGYFEDEELRWRILDGADQYGVPDPKKLFETIGNSRDRVIDPFAATVAIPKIDLNDASTKLVIYRAAMVPIGPRQRTVPLVPKDGFFAPFEAQ